MMLTFPPRDLVCRLLLEKKMRRRHGPYWYFRFEEFDRRTGQTRYRREYVPESELARVRRWIRRSRAASGRGRAVLSFLRHYVTGMEARARRRARMRASGARARSCSANRTVSQLVREPGGRLNGSVQRSSGVIHR